MEVLKNYSKLHSLIFFQQKTVSSEIQKKKLSHVTSGNPR